MKYDVFILCLPQPEAKLLQIRMQLVISNHIKFDLCTILNNMNILKDKL